MKVKYILICLAVLALTMGCASASHDIDAVNGTYADELQVTDQNDLASPTEDANIMAKDENIITIRDDDIKLENPYNDIVSISAPKNSKGTVAVISGNETLFSDDISKLYYFADLKEYEIKLHNLSKTLTAGKLPIKVTYGKYSQEGTLTLVNIDPSKPAVRFPVMNVIFPKSKPCFCQIEDDDYLNGTVDIYIDGEKVYTEELGLDKEIQSYYVSIGIHHTYLTKKLTRGTHNLKIVYQKNGISKPFTKEKTIYYTTKKHFKMTLKTIKVKKSAKKITLTAVLKINGKKAKDVSLLFNFNKKGYRAYTNAKGVAKVTIKKNALKKLKVGKKVKYSVTRGKISVKKTAKVYR